jgi:hypothetical protein
VAQVELITAEITGRGRIQCRRCDGLTAVQTCGILMWDTGTKSMVETTSNELLHRCGRVLEWWCPTCDNTDGYERGRRWDKFMACSICLAAMDQRLAR